MWLGVQGPARQDGVGQGRLRTPKSLLLREQAAESLRLGEFCRGLLLDPTGEMGDRARGQEL